MNLPLKCPHCHESYTTTEASLHLPRVFPCGHTVCDACVSLLRNKCEECDAQYYVQPPKNFVLIQCDRSNNTNQVYFSTNSSMGTIEIECPYCMENFTTGEGSLKMPLVLTCGHTTCSNCISALRGNCGECRHIIPFNAPQNFALLVQQMPVHHTNNQSSPLTSLTKFLVKSTNSFLTSSYFYKYFALLMLMFLTIPFLSDVVMKEFYWYSSFSLLNIVHIVYFHQHYLPMIKLIFIFVILLTLFVILCYLGYDSLWIATIMLLCLYFIDIKNLIYQHSRTIKQIGWYLAYIFFYFQLSPLVVLPSWNTVVCGDHNVVTLTSFPSPSSCAAAVTIGPYPTSFLTHGLTYQLLLFSSYGFVQRCHFSFRQYLQVMYFLINYYLICLPLFQSEEPPFLSSTPPNKFPFLVIFFCAGFASALYLDWLQILCNFLFVMCSVFWKERR